MSDKEDAQSELIGCMAVIAPVVLLALAAISATIITVILLSL